MRNHSQERTPPVRACRPSTYLMVNFLFAAYTLLASGTSAGPSVAESLNSLKTGNERFVVGTTEHPHQSLEHRNSLVKKQTPYAVIVTCSDSRVVPEFIFDQGIGDLFVVRIAGNTVSKRELGSIEYAVEHLGSKLIVVMGHTNCGAVKAALGGGVEKLPGSVGAIVKPIVPAVSASHTQLGDRLSNAVITNVKLVVGGLGKGDPLMKELLHTGKAKVVGAVYHLENGKVTFLP